jgi:two-component system, OmpR family, phosphate regulon sensor histidine kinase PhoR
MKQKILVVDDEPNMTRGLRDGFLGFIEVEDHGIGIARVHQRNIFEQFYRVPTNNVHNIQGTGLGLALVKRTMIAHKGKVKVSSVPGKGSIFSLFFPLASTAKDIAVQKDV